MDAEDVEYETNIDTNEATIENGGTVKEAAVPASALQHQEVVECAIEIDGEKSEE